MGIQNTKSIFIPVLSNKWYLRNYTVLTLPFYEYLDTKDSWVGGACVWSLTLLKENISEKELALILRDLCDQIDPDKNYFFSALVENSTNVYEVEFIVTLNIEKSSNLKIEQNSLFQKLFCSTKRRLGSERLAYDKEMESFI